LFISLAERNLAGLCDRVCLLVGFFRRAGASLRVTVDKFVEHPVGS